MSLERGITRADGFSTRCLLVSVLLCGAIAAGAAAPVAAPGTVTLRYGMKPGVVYEQGSSMSLSLKVDPSGLPPALIGMLQSMAGEMKQDMTMKGRFDIREKAADGSLPLQYRLVEARATFTRGTEVKDVPGVAAAAEKPPVAGRVTSDARRIEIDSATDSENLPQTLRDQIGQSMPALPEGALKVGDSFEFTVAFGLPGPASQGGGRTESHYVYTLRSVDAGEALFDVRQTFPPGPGVTLADGRSIQVSGGSRGTAIFNLKEGLFSSVKLDTDIQMILGMPMPPGLTGGGDAAGSENSGTAALELKSVIKGPVTMTLGRSSAR